MVDTNERQNDPITKMTIYRHFRDGEYRIPVWQLKTPSIDGVNLRYDMFVKAYNETREHGGINGLTPSEMFLQ